MMLEYLDFEMKIERRQGNEYAVSVIKSPAGEASGTFILPFTPERLKDIRETIDIALVRSMMPVRRMVPPEFERVEEFGRELYTTLFRNDVKSCCDRSFSLAFGQGKGLRLKLRLDPTLTNLPWEFMYSREMRDYLALSRTIPPVRYTELPQPAVPLEVTLPLRILVVIASPSDYAPLNVEHEKERITSALKELQERGIIKVEFLEGKNTLAVLQRRLRRADVHVLHFIGHGDYDEEAEEGLLLMEDARGRGRPVTGQWLGRLLRGYFPVRLVVLNACEGALTSSSDPFAGVAAAVVGAGVPAVVAMQLEISDEAAIIFSREFYSALADNYPVDGAVTEARMAIVHSRRNTIEWSTPVLYMRAPDGILFTLQELPEPEPERLAALYAQAKALFEAENWSEAIARCEEMLAIETSYRDAVNLLAEAKKGLAHQEKEEQVTRLYNEALESSRQGDWQQTIVKLQRVLDLEEDYKDAAAKLAAAQEELGKAVAERERRERLAAVYEEAVAAMKLFSWRVVAFGGAALLVVLVGIAIANWERLWTLLAPTTVATATATLPVETPAPHPTMTSLRPTSTTVRVLPSAVTAIPTDTPMAPTATSRPTHTSTLAPTRTAIPGPTHTPTPTDTPTPPVRKVAFVSNRDRNRDGKWEVYVMDVDGSGPVNLTNHPAADDESPDWSPDGKKIAFYSMRDGNREVYVMNADGTGLMNLTNNRADDYNPAWSPDGKKIAFNSERDGNREVYVMNADGTGLVNLTNHRADDDVPAWSPDGKRIAFDSNRDDNWEVHVMNADGSGPVVNLTNHPAADYNPAWSPDGKKIAFYSMRDGNWEVYVMNADGTGLVNLTNNPAHDLSPDWSP